MKKSSVIFSLLLIIGTGISIQAQSKSNLFRKTLEIGKSREIKTDISFFAGELNINGSTDKLAECFYGYKDHFLRPEMAYNEINEIGYLTINSEKAEKGMNQNDLDHSNKWSLCLNKKLKNALSIKLTAGKTNIDLEGCKLSCFDYKMTAGESNINLRNTSVPQMQFNLLAGEANIDLSGEWHNDMVAIIKGGVGEITVKVPFNTGVRITASGVLGEINMPFFNRNGNTYTNDLYEKTKYTLHIDISGGIGQINVEMVE